MTSSAVILSATRSGNTLILSWPQGILQSATNISGPYSDNTSASSPYPVPLSGAQQFFRVRVPR